jgi:ABC-type uncharacterized transport system permease subunit
MKLAKDFRDMIAIYIQQYRTTFASMVQYRASLFIWMISQVLEPLVDGGQQRHRQRWRV